MQSGTYYFAVVSSNESGFALSNSVEVTVERPLDVPTNAGPQNETEITRLNPTLSVNVGDPDEDLMTVSFYDASTDTLIGSISEVADGETASVSWAGLEQNTEYSWYVIVDNGENDSIQSQTWNFTTSELATEDAQEPAPNENDTANEDEDISLENPGTAMGFINRSNDRNGYCLLWL